MGIVAVVVILRSLFVLGRSWASFYSGGNGAGSMADWSDEKSTGVLRPFGKLRTQQAQHDLIGAP
jgi:hypothetical protein